MARGAKSVRKWVPIGTRVPHLMHEGWEKLPASKIDPNIADSMVTAGQIYTRIRKERHLEILEYAERSDYP